MELVVVIVDVLIPNGTVIVCERCGWWTHPRGHARRPIKDRHIRECPTGWLDEGSFWQFEAEDMVVMINVRNHQMRVISHKFLYA